MKKILNIGDLKLSYREINPDKEIAIIFIHGNSQAASTFHRQMNSEDLSEYRLITLDLPGHGNSDRPAHYSIPSLVNAIRGFVIALDLKNYVLAGHSLGGHLVLQTLSDLNPLGIFLTGTPPLSKPFNPEAFRPHPSFGLFYESHVTDEDLEILLRDLYSGEDDLAGGKYAFRRTDPQFRPALLASIGAGEFQDEIVSWNSFKGVKKIIGTENDKVINFEIVRDRIPETVIIPGGHNPHLECADIYNQELARIMNNLINNRQVTTVREESLHG